MENYSKLPLLLPIIICMFLLPIVSTAAPIEAYQFDSPHTEKVFHKLSEELRCLVCQNQSIAESNADLAKDLRLEVYNMLMQGKTEQEIVGFMVQRYGDYVMYRPPLKPMTWLLWFGPVLVFFLVLFFVMRYLKSQVNDVPVEKLSETEVKRIKNLHAEQDQNSQG